MQFYLEFVQGVVVLFIVLNFMLFTFEILQTVYLSQMSSRREFKHYEYQDTFYEGQCFFAAKIFS